MDLSINFANPIDCYDNILNKCAGKYCHVECTVKIDVSMLRFLFDTALNECYAPTICQNIINNINNLEGDITVAFYILFGDIFSMRILNDEEENTFLQLPKAPIYEIIKIKLEEEKMYEVIKWNICMLGRNYDITRAVLLLTPISISLNTRPEKFFCSQIIMYMLKENDIVEVEGSLDINHMKPDHVYEWLFQKNKGIKENVTELNGE